MTNNTTPETTPVKLSNLTPEEQQECIGMWVWGESRFFGKAWEGFILRFDQNEVIVYVPKFEDWVRRCPSELILLPDYQRAFTADGHPTSIDPGQWVKTHDMEEEFDRITTNSDLTHCADALQAIMDTATQNGIPITEALLTPGGDITLFFDKEHN